MGILSTTPYIPFMLGPPKNQARVLYKQTKGG
jgi:hypothetical protein